MGYSYCYPIDNTIIQAAKKRRKKEIDGKSSNNISIAVDGNNTGVTVDNLGGNSIFFPDFTYSNYLAYLLDESKVTFKEPRSPECMLDFASKAMEKAIKNLTNNFPAYDEIYVLAMRAVDFIETAKILENQKLKYKAKEILKKAIDLAYELSLPDDLYGSNQKEPSKSKLSLLYEQVIRDYSEREKIKLLNLKKEEEGEEDDNLIIEGNNNNTDKMLFLTPEEEAYKQRQNEIMRKNQQEGKNLSLKLSSLNLPKDIYLNNNLPILDENGKNLSNNGTNGISNNDDIKSPTYNADHIIEIHQNRLRELGINSNKNKNIIINNKNLPSKENESSDSISLRNNDKDVPMPINKGEVDKYDKNFYLEEVFLSPSSQDVNPWSYSSLTQQQIKKSAAINNRNSDDFSLQPSSLPFPYNLRRGLENLGNTCYLNSVLQCLASVNSLYNFFNKEVLSSEIYNNCIGNARVINSFGGIILMLNSYHRNRIKCDSDDTTVSPSSLKMEIGKRNCMFEDYAQQDASEFFLCLINSIHDDINNKSRWITEVPSSKSSSLKGTEDDFCKVNLIKSTNNNKSGPKLYEKAVLSMRQFLTRNSYLSVILSTFLTQTVSTIKCLRCNNISRTFGIDFSLDLPLPQNSTFVLSLRNKYTIFECLKEFCGVQKIESRGEKDENGYDCEHCKSRTCALRQTTLYSLPEVVVLTLKRFKSHGNFSNKLNDCVLFPPEIDFSPYCLSDNVSVGNSSGVDCRNINGSSSSSHLSKIIPPISSVIDTAVDVNSRKSSFLVNKGTHGGSGGSYNRTEDNKLSCNSIYRLFGVINHRGSLNGGHYTADVCISEVGYKWLSISDERVEEASSPSFSHAYMLFYQRSSSEYP